MLDRIKDALGINKYHVERLCPKNGWETIVSRSMPRAHAERFAVDYNIISPKARVRIRRSLKDKEVAG